MFLPGQVDHMEGAMPALGPLPWVPQPWVPPPWTSLWPWLQLPPPTLGPYSVGLPVGNSWEGQTFPKGSHACFSLQKVQGEALAHPTWRARLGMPGPTPTHVEAQAPAPG